MKYNNVCRGKFIDRPNRFIAHVEIDGQTHVCHVKNTGRCRELLVPGADVLLEKSDNPARKTAYDLISVYKNGVLINMDSQSPNKIAMEYLPVLFPNGQIKPEQTYGASRFDFFVQDGKRRIFLEVKGVTLESGGIAMFPDAPTQRGVKHINELARSIDEGYEAYLLFVVQMKGVTCLRPNDETHPQFGDALRTAAAKGVHLLAVDCIVKPDTVTADAPVKIVL
jgi:sugar fermentation stimulation protein A